MSDGEWEYGFNTGSTVTLIGTRERAEEYAASFGAVVGKGDMGSRFQQRRRAGSWLPAEPTEEER